MTLLSLIHEIHIIIFNREACSKFCVEIFARPAKPFDDVYKFY